MSTRIAVIGGGPAGSATTLHLLRQGVDPSDILIIDKAVFPRPKLCGGAITFRGTQDLAALGVAPAGGGATLGLQLSSPFGTLELREPGPQLLFDRASLDAQLLARCRAAGVEVREGCKIEALDPGAEGWRIRSGNAVTLAPWVIGADGVSGITRRASGLHPGRIGRLLEAVFEAPAAPLPDNVLHFYFDPLADGIMGYAWIFPYPLDGRTDLWKIGIMEVRDRVPSEQLRAWLVAFAAKRGFTRMHGKVAGWPEHFYSWRNEPHREGLLLVGEAHGTDPLFGEGIAPAFEMAAFAAPRVKAALDAGSRRIPAYRLRFAMSEEGRNLMLQSFLAYLLYGRNSRRWLRTFFENEHIRTLGPTGMATYGRLLRHKTNVIRTWLTGMLRSQ